jgi:hypothetical protein
LDGETWEVITVDEDEVRYGLAVERLVRRKTGRLALQRRLAH